MEVTFDKGTYSVTKTYFLSNREIEIMKFISDNERIDFQELKYGWKNPKDETGTFLYDECGDLIGQGFIEADHEWMYSYVFTAFGRYFVNENPLFQGGEKE